MKNPCRLTLTFLICLCTCLSLGSMSFAEPSVPQETQKIIIVEEFGDTAAFGADLYVSGTSGALEWKLYSDGLLTISGEGQMSDYAFDDYSKDWREYNYICVSG